jgi:hypothetical protein
MLQLHAPCIVLGIEQIDAPLTQALQAKAELPYNVQ